MPYPPPHFHEKDEARIAALMREHPFAHLFTSGPLGHRTTRLPFVTDVEDGRIIRLRAHFSRQNPQSEILDGAAVLVAFSGPASYVSPNWRTEQNRGATWDYLAVQVWGTARVREDRGFFEQLINDVASAVEPRFDGVSDRPDWSMKDAPKDYVDRLFPALVPFEISVSAIEATSKLHQNFPEEDIRSVADHLGRADNASSQAVSDAMREALARRQQR